MAWEGFLVDRDAAVPLYHQIYLQLRDLKARGVKIKRSRYASVTPMSAG